jgi:hypothetical protein
MSGQELLYFLKMYTQYSTLATAVLKCLHLNRPSSAQHPHLLPTFLENIKLNFCFNVIPAQKNNIFTKDIQ